MTATAKETLSIILEGENRRQGRARAREREREREMLLSYKMHKMYKMRARETETKGPTRYTRVKGEKKGRERESDFSAGK